ncbi:5667_t:CDS:2 [Funneliformis geosporum]|nr:5667_t:CDS:2 [Funneliformis geosporum]
MFTVLEYFYGSYQAVDLLFYVKNEEYDISLAIEILGGLREKIIPGTPEDYVNIYTGCWDNGPDNRLSINQVVD